jgi:hypothetical protein
MSENGIARDEGRREQLFPASHVPFEHVLVPDTETCRIGTGRATVRRVLDGAFGLFDYAQPNDEKGS